MKNIEIVVKVTGTIERLNFFLFKGKFVFFVYLSFESMKLCEKSRPERTILLAPKRMHPLVCEVYNMDATKESVWRFMPGNKVSFEGVLASDKKRHMLIVSSIIIEDGPPAT